jgi:hypothetical protein
LETRMDDLETSLDLLAEIIGPESNFLVCLDLTGPTGTDFEVYLLCADKPDKTLGGCSPTMGARHCSEGSESLTRQGQ